MDIIELLVKHPTFKSHKENFTITYSGTIIVNADSYKVVVKEVSTDQGKQFELIDKYGCLQKFKEQMEILKQQKAANILSYVDYIEKIIKEHGHFPKNQCFLHRKVLHEYMEFTKFLLI
ncbi:hypothetical protein HHI36_008310 [Cryptolaemus montrouzieri]|uniref:Uncharacterized protein n=1 Tax=Cryptolaemus montrouzieri TaxID=559131 RepID=A0ABD2MS04_9CUCU